MTAMKNSKLRTGAAVTIKRLFLLISLISIPASLLMAQSVADAAKTERERRERVKGQGKVFTDSDLKSISERSNVTTGTLGKGINTSPNQGIVAIPVRRVGSAMIVSASRSPAYWSPTGRSGCSTSPHPRSTRLATRSSENGDTEILRVDSNGFAKIYSCDVLELCGPAQFHKDGKRVYIETNKGADVNFVRLEVLDAETGKAEVAESDPLGRVDLGEVLFSDVTDQLIATVYVDDKQRIYWKDKNFESDYKWLMSQLPGKEIGYSSHTRDEQMWLLSASADTEPGETFLFDRKARKLTLEYRIREKLPREYLASVEPIRYESSDGTEIPAYLTLPKGVPAKNLPVLLMPHGGPWARDTWGYRGFSQFFANRGYAVLSSNFRGSTGYGKKFINAGNRQWGEKMQDDLTWGVKYLVAKGTADPKRVGIMGGSYGGYATLAGVAFTPDVYAAAVSIVGPSNLIYLLESIPPYWEAGRKMFHQRMGDPGTPEGRAQLERQSPLNSANKIKTPLLVAQGANDPRVNKAESDRIVIALRDRGFPVEYLVAPDEGHGFQRPVNNMAMMAAAESCESNAASNFPSVARFPSGSALVATSVTLCLSSCPRRNASPFCSALPYCPISAQ